MKDQKSLAREALKLPPGQRAELAEELLKSLDQPDREIDLLWKKESESRIEAYEKGKVDAASVEEVISRYKFR